MYLLAILMCMSAVYIQVQIAHSTITITETDGPDNIVIKDGRKELLVATGSDVVLTCTVEGEAQSVTSLWYGPSLAISFQNNLIHPDSVRFSITMQRTTDDEATEYTIRIRDLQLDDSGNYRCQEIDGQVDQVELIVTNDTTPPVVSCISDVTITVPSTNDNGTIVTWTEPTATDNIEVVNTTQTHTPGSVFDLGTTPVTYTFTDGTNNSASCTFNVNVVIETLPIRLMFRSYSGEPDGFVQILYSGQWKYLTVVNSPSLNSNNIAKVLCRQLGYSGLSDLINLELHYSPNLDDVWFHIKDCTGEESAIEHCSRSPFGTRSYVEGTMNVAVKCDGQEPPRYRLIEGWHPFEGIVEVYFETRYITSWGSVCAKSSSHSTDLSGKICSQLGYTNGTAHTVASSVFENSGANHLMNVWLHVGDCSDDADRLEDCQHTPWGLGSASEISYCDEGSEYLAVICNGSEPGPFRLVGGSRPSEGLVEMQFEGFIGWGSVCLNFDSPFTDLSGRVCRQLGYSEGTSYMVASDVFGESYNPIWLHVGGNCTSEDRLEDCKIAHWGSDFVNCDLPHNDYLAVVCNGDESALRLIHGSSSQGLVQIKFNNTWRAICGDIGPRNAPFRDYGEIICRQLGYTSGSSYMVSPFLFGVGLSAVWLNVGDCQENVTRIQDCLNKPWGNYGNRYTCDSENSTYVAVVCSDSTPVPRPIRLVGSSQPNEGRLEIKINETWGRVCIDQSSVTQWDRRNADVVCRQLGFTLWSHVIGSGKFGKGSGPVWLTDVQCTGTESDIDSCVHSLWGHRGANTECLDIAVVCDVPSPVSIGLVGGTVPSEGLLEVYFHGEVGHVCNKTWNENNTKVVCQQLGFTDGISYSLPSEVLGISEVGTPKTWFDEVSCNGDEEYIHNCPHSPWGAKDAYCTSHGNDVSIVCNGQTPEIRLVGGSNSREGRVEINFRGQWGTICARESTWSDTEAGVVCRQLGYSTGWAFATSSAMFGQGNGIIWLEDVQCQANENTLAECRHRPWFAYRECDHSHDVGVICEEDRSSGLQASHSSEIVR